MSTAIKDQISPITGIISEEIVYLDFGDHSGKSVMEIFDTDQPFYQYMLEKKEAGQLLIKRYKDKTFRLFLDRF